MNPTIAGIVGMACLFLLFVIRMPIPFAMGLVGVIGFSLIATWDQGLSILGRMPYTNSSSYDLVVIPLFMMMGFFFLHSGFSSDLYNTMYKILGRLPGGLGIATIITCAGFSCICGSAPATIATIGSVAFPEMKKYKYDDGLACGIIAAGGNLGILIPPSIIFVIYGMLSEQSIGKLFMAGIWPGVMLSIVMVITILLVVWRHPGYAPKSEEHFTFREKLVSLKNAWVIIFLFAIVMGGIYSGIFTATEAASVGAALALIIAIARRRMSWKNFKDAMMDSIQMTGMIFAGLMASQVLGQFLAITKIPMSLATWITTLEVSRYVIMSGILIVMFIMGMFIEAMSLIILMIPILMPVVFALDFNPIWFGVIVVLITEVGLISPPVASGVFLTSLVTSVPIPRVYRGVMPFVWATIVAAFILVFWQQLPFYVFFK